jgi:4-alpha-glucanotransferase
VHEGVCRRLLDARSWLAVLMVTDALGLNLRFNVPGPVADSNWSERLPFTVSSIPTEWSHRLRDWIAASGRIP